MFRFWYALFFLLTIVGLTRTINAGGDLMAVPSAAMALRLLGWTAFLAANGFMLAFQDYRVQKAHGKVRQPVAAFERLLRRRPNRKAGDRKESNPL